MKITRRIVWTITGIAILGFVSLLGATVIEHLGFPGREAAVAPAVDIRAEFSLTDHTGQAVTETDYAGRPLIVFFGFTACPDVCPTALSAVSRILDELGPEGEDLQPLFITVDPERDTVNQMASYVTLFHPRIVGLTGTPEQVAGAARNFGAYFRRVPLEGGGYTMDHTASGYLMDGEGRFRGTVDIHENPDIALEKVKLFLKGELRGPANFRGIGS
ncbi:SCO family protein [Inquilinus sp. CAU 1745]|uniref:SCO family protein n=1 Tax=Inquilinus sp. CAU 1745 TaxID=3140369 RepID=UPI00325A6526